MYEFTEEMGEISGFGGGYEAVCRKMLKNGLEWLDANPEADPHISGYKNLYGIINEDNDDAKALSKAVMTDIEDATGAMHQAVMTALLWIKANGWDKYVEAMSKPKDKVEK